jgi:hypothetical protein
LVFITKIKSVYSAVRTGSLNKTILRFVFKGVMALGCKFQIMPNTERF